MSGIAGIYYLDGRPVEETDLQRMLESIAHRGPDGSGIWTDGPVGLGHRMLWTTPESLHEKLPLTNKSGDLTITADARIDNRDELIPALNFNGRPRETITDSEIILAAYEKWGAKCPEKPENEPSLKVEFSSFIGNFQPLSNRFMQWSFPGGEPWLSCAKTDSGYLLRFNELADFTIDRNGREIVCMPRPGIPEDTLQHLLLDQVIPLVINLRGGEALHASAILTPRGVVAFAGPAGSGKSTITASLLKMGYPFVSDDCLTLQEKDQNIYAIPAYPGLRLWKDAEAHLFGDNGNKKSVAHYTSKLRVDIKEEPGSYSPAPKPFARLYDIMNSPETDVTSDITIERLSPRDSFMALVGCAFRLDITDSRMLRRQFCFLERVVSAVSVRRLIFPRDFTLLPAIQEAIFKDLRNSSN